MQSDPFGISFICARKSLSALLCTHSSNHSAFYVDDKPQALIPTSSILQAASISLLLGVKYFFHQKHQLEPPLQPTAGTARTALTGAPGFSIHTATGSTNTTSEVPYSWEVKETSDQKAQQHYGFQNCRMRILQDLSVWEQAAPSCSSSC